jgi:hypothetical protein
MYCPVAEIDPLEYKVAVEGRPLPDPSVVQVAPELLVKYSVLELLMVTS